MIKKLQLVKESQRSSTLHTTQGVNLFGSQPGNNSNLDPIKLLWSQIKQLQSNISCRAEKNCSRNLGKILPTYLKSLHKRLPRRMKAVVITHEGRDTQISNTLWNYIIYYLLNKPINVYRVSLILSQIVADPDWILLFGFNVVMLYNSVAICIHSFFYQNSKRVCIKSAKKIPQRH